MAEFRIQGKTLNGKPVKGIINAETQAEAKKRINQMAKARNFTVSAVEKRKVFVYKIGIL